MRLISFYCRTRISGNAVRAFLLRDDFSKILQKTKNGTLDSLFLVFLRLREIDKIVNLAGTQKVEP